MNRLPPDPSLLELQPLFAVEREILPEPEDVCNRALRRARAAMAYQSMQAGGLAPARRARLGRVAAAAVILLSLCAAAFEAGYQMKARTATVKPTVVKAPTAPPPRLVPEQPGVQPPAPSAPAPSARQAFAPPHRPKVKPATPENASAEPEARELRVLQPALDAVASRDFSAALVAVAAHQKRFPSGQLAEEREALRVKALIGLGRMAEAQRAGAAFRQSFPHGTLQGEVVEMLGLEK